MQSVIDTITGNNASFTQEDVSDLRGRTALITGGTKGIGFEVARALALAKARVLVLSRKADHGDQAVATIKEHDPTANVEFVELDLGDLAAVKEAADRICKTEKRLDILVAGAGIGVNAFAHAASGLDRHFGVNHLGHFLLINRLLPLIRSTAVRRDGAAPRIITISSELHRMAPSSVAFSSPAEVTEDVNIGPTGYYARSKLAGILFTKYGLLERVITPNRDHILALAVHPGAVHTEQQEQFKEAYGVVLGTIMKSLTVPFMRTPEEGSLCALWAATSGEVEKDGMNGKYFTDPGHVSDGSTQAQDPELGKSLWELSEQLVKQKLGKDALLPWDVAARDS